MKKLLSCVLLTAALIATTSRAALIMTEPFNYPDGAQIAAEPNWASHSGAGSGPQLVTNQHLRVVFANSEDDNVQIPQSPWNPAFHPLNQFLWASFTLNAESLPGDTNSVNNNYFAHFKDTSSGAAQTNGFRCRIFAYTNGAVAPNTFRLALTAAGGAVTNVDYTTYPMDLATNSEYTVVMRLDLFSGASRMWINASNSTDLNVGTTNGIPNTDTDISYFAFRQVGGSVPGSVLLGKLKIGTTFNDVAGTNTPPFISTLSTLNTPANTPIVVPFTVGDDHYPATNLTVTATSQTSSIVPGANLQLSGTSSNRTLTITPANNAQGTALVTLRVTNPNNAFSTNQFMVVVGAPSISTIPPQILALGATPQPIPFTVSDHESAATSLTVTGTSGNQTLVPNGNITLTSIDGTNRTVKVTPVAGQTGIATISIRCSDGVNAVTNTFTFDVAPNYGLLLSENFDSYSAGTSLSFAGDVSGGIWHQHSGTFYQLIASNQPNSLTNMGAYVSFPTTNSEDIHASILNGNAEFSTNSGAVLYYGFSIRQLTLPTTDNGDYFIHLRDTASSFHGKIFVCRTNAAPNTFRIGVAGGANAPSAVYPLDLTTNTLTYCVVRYNVGSGETVLWVNPTSQTSPNVTSTDFGVPPSGIDDICLRESGAVSTPSSAGTQIVDDLKVSSAFSDVAPSIFPPTISAIPNQKIAVSGSTGPIPFTVSDAQTTPNNLIYTVTSDNTALLPTNNIVLAGGSSTNRTMTITPVAGQSGFVNVTITITDSLSLTATRSLLVTVGNPPTNGIVFSQIYPGGGNSNATYNTKFVELFNHSATPVSLNNWSLQYSSSTGTTWSAAAFNNVTVPAYSYYLVAIGNAGATGVVLPVSTDLTLSSINPSQTVGKLALCNSQTPLVGASPLPNSTVCDFVGYGAGTSAYEGSGPVNWTTDNTMAMYRASAGCTDTDNNAADISSALVSPRNSASAINVCQGAPPSMRAFINNGNLTIAWPTSATGFNLETASAVNQNPWNVVSVAPTVVGSENQVTVLINGTAFFRLKK